MDACCRRPAYFPYLFVGLALCAPACGCRLAAQRGPFARDADESPAAESPQPPGEQAAKPVDASLPSDDSTKHAPAALTVLKQDGWVPALSASSVTIKAGYHWTHAGLEGLALVKGRDRPDLPAALNSDDPTIAANAAILNARWGGYDVTKQLADAVRNASLQLTQRCAAADSLALVTQPSPLDDIRALVDELCSFTPEHQSRYLPTLHVALLQALAQQPGAAGDERLSEALKSPSPLVRLEALEGWSPEAPSGQDAKIELPESAFALCEDDDARVRARALRLLAQRRHPRAVEILTRALADYDFSVRAAVIAGLGEFGGPEARKALEKLREHPAELVRAEVIAALARLGAADAVLAAAEDKSWRVRLAVADSLRSEPRDEAALARQTALAESLVEDISTQVQERAVDAVAGWRPEAAGGVLLAALEKGGYRTRKLAAEKLATHWSPAADFPTNGSAERRTEALGQLRRKWLVEHPPAGQLGVSNAESPNTTGGAVESPRIDSARAAEIEELLEVAGNPNTTPVERRSAIAALNGCGAEVLALVERHPPDPVRPLPSELYRDVLADSSPTFAELDRLTSESAAQRRTAAAALVPIATREPLSPHALQRLTQLMTIEQDPVVWQYALTVVARDGREPAVQMAYMAIGHSSPEVRRRACEYLAAHAEPRHAGVLVPSLEDHHGPVVVAAVRALGKVGALNDLRPLVQLLLANDKQLRLEAAESLTRLHVAEGPAALERLALDPDADIRRRAAQVMGSLADAAFVPALLPLLEDRPEIQRAALSSLTQIVGRDVGRSESSETLTPQEQSRRWQRWYRDARVEKQ